MKTATTRANTDVTTASFVTSDYGPIGGTVYWACDEGWNSKTTGSSEDNTSNESLEKAREMVEFQAALKVCENDPSRPPDVTPTDDKKDDDDETSLTWLWWILGVLGFLIIAFVIYYFAVIRAKRIEAAHHAEVHGSHHPTTYEMNHHTTGHHVDVVHHDVHH